MWCNALLVDVPATSVAPGSEEHAQGEMIKTRHAILRRQLRSASVIYAISIVFLAVIPGMIFDPVVLLMYALSGLVVGFTTVRDITGQLMTPLLQGGLSVTILYFFPQSLQPMIFFMLAGHVVFPGIFYVWIESIYKSQY